METITGPVDLKFQRARSSLVALLRWPLWVCIPTDRVSDTLKILFVSTTFTIFALYTTGYQFAGGAYQFLDWAVAIARGDYLPARIEHAQRDIGFPLLLWLGGYPQTYSLLGITVIHAMMALLMPALIYHALRPFSAPAGFYGGIISLFSLFPFLNLKMIYHDQAYAFFVMLGTWLLIAYIMSRQPPYLRLGALSFVVASVTRPAGNLLFPTFIVLAVVFVRAPIRRYALPVVLGASLLLGYSYYRHVLFRVPLGHEMPTYAGQQVFYNVYINAKEFGVVLSPELGPSMRELGDRAYPALLPDPRSSPRLKEYRWPREFSQRHVYPYSAEQMLSQLYARPNWEYYIVLAEAARDEKLLLLASWEIARRYPLYPLKYTLRNLWHLLTAPGWKHSRYNAEPFGPEANRFPLDLHGYTQLQNIPPEAPATKELRFYDLDALPGVVQRTYRGFRDGWPANFSRSLRLSFYLMVVASVAVCLKYLTEALRFPGLSTLKRTLNGVLPGGTASAFIAVSIIFLEEMTIISALGEPDLRYYYMMLGLRFIVAGFGVSVAFNLLGQLLRHFGSAKRLAGAGQSIVPNPSARTKILFATALGCCAVAGIVGWVLHVVRQVW